MTMKTEGERLATMENEIKNMDSRIEAMTKSVDALHGKFDSLTTILTTSYVAKETFDEYKRGRTLERILTILATAVISGLVAFFLRANNV